MKPSPSPRSLPIRWQTLLLLTLALLAAACMLLLIVRWASQPGEQTLSPSAWMQVVSGEEAAVRQAVETAIAENKATALPLLIYDTRVDNITISADGQWATAWLTPLDPQSGEAVPLEPGLAIARKENDVWKAYLPSDPLWSVMIQQAPDDLVSPEQKAEWKKRDDFRPEALNVTFSGYYLPFPGGDTMALTQSTAHDRYTPNGSAHYSFDFATPGYPSKMFNVAAAKGGYVKQAVWTHANGNEANGNYIVLEDRTTNPVSYQLYLHLAQNSIPSEIRTIGTYVRQGRLVGVADDTGISSGHHLHFMVHTNAASYWGNSVDITFQDVSINGGRPRISVDLPFCKSADVCTSVQSYYTSRNFETPDPNPPSGGITTPSMGEIVGTTIVPINGWARDDNSGIASVQLQARYTDQWRPIGSAMNTTSFTLNWDMCAAGVPNGPVSLAVEVMDKAGNRTQPLNGLTHFIKNAACPVTAPTTCTPSANQVALFASSDYSGECVLLGAGSYTTAASLGSLGDNNAASILVGANVHATLYSSTNLQGRAETFAGNDSNLAGNRIGADTTSSVLVRTRSTSPAAPLPVSPADRASLPVGASFSLAWADAGGGYEFQARVMQNQVELFTFPWQVQTVWHLSSLPAGTYTWQVKARNSAAESSWSTARTLTILPGSGSASIPPFNPPFTDSMEAPGAWTHSGAWSLSTDGNHTPDGASAWKYTPGSGKTYDTGAANSGYLTSPPITIPSGDANYLRFWYQYETEGPYTFWDQRQVQISIDGGPFINLLQLSNDAPNVWLRSPAISLASFAGSTIQVRFYFATLDSAHNQYWGWMVDDFSVTTDPPPDCDSTNGEPNNTPGQATPIVYNVPAEGWICPGGDLDFYSFTGEAGDQIGIHTAAQQAGSPLDTNLFLLDSDGNSVLAQNDDLVSAQLTDSFITYQLKRSGTYYIRVQAWDNPTSGDKDHQYTLHLVKDDQPPLAMFINPVTGGPLAAGPVQLQVGAIDIQSGISHVQFYWHAPDWQNGAWIFLGEDWNGLDGWTQLFNAAQVPDITGAAFYAIAYDWGGNPAPAGAWLVRQPRTYFPIIRK